MDQTLEGTSLNSKSPIDIAYEEKVTILKMLTAQLDIEKKKAEIENLSSLNDLNQATELKKNLAGLIPTLPTNSLAGTVTADSKAGCLTDIVAYRAMEHVAVTIANEITEYPAESVLIINDTDIFASNIAYCEIVSNLQMLKEALDTQTKKNDNLSKIPEETEFAEISRAVKFSPVFSVLPTAMAVGSTAIEAASKVLEYLRSNYTLTTKDITITNEALRSFLAGKLTGKGMKVYMENFFLTNDTVCDTFKIFTLISSLKKGCILLEASKTLLSSSGDASTSAPNKLAIEESTVILKAVEQYLKDIRTSAKPEVLTPLFTAMRYECIKYINPDYLLYTNVLSTGGDVITKQSFISPWSYYGHIAGCSAMYLLGDMNGKIVSANTISKAYSFIIKPDKLPYGKTASIEM